MRITVPGEAFADSKSMERHFIEDYKEITIERHCIWDFSSKCYESGPLSN